MGDTFGEKWWPTAASGKANADIQAMTYAEIEVLQHEVNTSAVCEIVKLDMAMGHFFCYLYVLQELSSFIAQKFLSLFASSFIALF